MTINSKDDEKSRKDKRRLALIFSLAAVLIIRFFTEIKLAEKFKINQGVKLNFCLSSQPYYGKDSQVFYYQKHFQKIKIKTDLDQKYDFGDCLQISGKIVSCPYSSKTKHCLLKPKISTCDQPTHYLILKKLKNIRQRLAEFYLQNLPYPYSDLLAGIVLGVKKNLDQKLVARLRQTGTLHIIVASGYNLMLMGEKPAYFLSFLIGQIPGILFGLFFVWFYVTLVGWQPPIVRAGILISVIFTARLAGRRFNQLRALLLTTWLMLIFKPDLIASISFQLSVAAALGISFAGKWFPKIQKWPILGSDLAQTLSAQIVVSPIIAYHFGRLSLLAPITNAFILPLIPTATMLGLSAILAAFLPFVGRLILFITYPFLWWSVKVIKIFSRFSITEISFGLPWWGIILMYLGVFIVFHIKSTIGKSN